MLAKAKAKTNETFIVQASLKIVTYHRQNIFIVQATDHHVVQQSGIVWNAVLPNVTVPFK
jgi:hypothetical protein